MTKIVDNYVPQLKTKKDVAEEAKEKIQEERSGKQLGLRTRFAKLNIAVGKYFRFKSVTAIAGLSGHGKSLILNFILNDFLNKALNGNFKEDVIIIHNSFEMSPVDEVIRNISNKLEKSHLYLLSSEFDKEKGNYNTISNEELELISNALDEDEDLDHYYFEDPTNINGILKNIKCGIEYYQEKYNTTNLPKVCVAIDHTLLVDPDKGESVLDMMGRLAKTAIYLKKRGYMVFFVGQLNNEIEKPERLKNPDLHFPVKSDIYAQAQVYNACDNVFSIHQPELLGILEYGKNRFVTEKLIHLQLLKQRFGKVGSIWLRNELERGQLVPFEPISKLK